MESIEIWSLIKDELLLIIMGCSVGVFTYMYFAGKENRYPPAVKYIVILLILTLISVTLWSNWDMKRRFAALHKQGSKSETKEINR